jgi:hypothetical protein
MKVVLTLIWAMFYYKIRENYVWAANIGEWATDTYLFAIKCLGFTAGLNPVANTRFCPPVTNRNRHL